MATFNTVAELIQILRDDPVILEELRSVLLTQELLDLPAAHARLAEEVREFVAATNRRFERVEADISELKTDVKQLKSDVSVLKTDVSQLKTDVSVLKTDVSQLKTDVSVLKTDMADVRGNSLEARLPNRIPQIVNREFGLRKTFPIYNAMGGFFSHRAEQFEQDIDAANADGLITDDEESRLRVTDLIMRAQKKADGSTLWVAVEASGTIHQNDIRRARASADALEKAFSQDAVALVYGFEIHDEDRDRATDANVQVFLEAR